MDEADYASTIADTFIRLRGNGLVLSSLDLELIDSWRQKAIPLHVAVNAIEEVMGNRGRATRPVRSLSYCSEEVEARYAEWLEGRVGAHE
jgi:hypothetical protein